MKISRTLTACGALGLVLFPNGSVSATNAPVPSAALSAPSSPEESPSTPDQPQVESLAGPRSLDELRLVGSAEHRRSGNVRLVSRRQAEVAGGGYIREPVDVSSFDVATTFLIRRGCTDGLALVIQNDGPRALGGFGGQIGYGRPKGITHSIAIELDTYTNDGEPRAPHVSLHTRGPLQNDARMPYSMALVQTSPIGDGNWHQVSANYADGVLQVSYEGEVIIEEPLDLATLLELPEGTAYVGVVGANGACTANIVLSDFTLTTP